MSITRSRPLVLASLVAVTATAGLALAQQTGEKPGTAPGPGAFDLVEGRTRVVECKAEGARVKKGDVVCVLDTASVVDRLRVQETLVDAAGAEHLAAQTAADAARMEVQEYLEGTYKQELETVLGEIALAESDRRRAEDRVAWSDRMLEKGLVAVGENIADKLSLRRAVFACEQVMTKKVVLEKYTKDRTTKELKAKAATAHAAERTKQAAWDRESATRRRLEAQIEACRLVAPAGGVVRLAQGVESGALVTEGQLLFRVAPEAK